MLGLGLLFVVSLMASVVHACLSSASEPSVVVTQPPAGQKGPALAQKQSPISPAAVKIKGSTTASVALPKETGVQLVPAFEPALTPVRVPETELASGSSPKSAPETADLPTPDKVEVVVQEPVNGGTCDVSKGNDDLFGTTVKFLATPALAGEEAHKQHKLLFVLHVSGNFEDPGFT
jgi:hypothetical protein